MRTQVQDTYTFKNLQMLNDPNPEIVTREGVLAENLLR